MHDPLLFAVTVLTLLCTPGPTNTLLATAGASVGWRRALGLIPAEGAGYLLSILTLGLVVGPMIASSPVVSTALRLAVGAFLLLTAWRLWRRGARTAIAGAALVTPRQVFVTTLLNPKAVIFAVGIFPFGASTLWLYVVAFLGMTAVVAAAWIAVGAGLARATGTGSGNAWVPRVGATVVGGFALMLVSSPLWH